jgi:hypothetical protein
MLLGLTICRLMAARFVVSSWRYTVCVGGGRGDQFHFPQFTLTFLLSLSSDAFSLFSDTSFFSCSFFLGFVHFSVIFIHSWFLPLVRSTLFFIHSSFFPFIHFSCSSFSLYFLLLYLNMIFIKSSILTFS